MFNIIPLVLILLSLGVIIIIVLRKFAVLANLDVDSIPAEREARVRDLPPRQAAGGVASHRHRRSCARTDTPRIHRPARAVHRHRPRGPRLETRSICGQIAD